MVTENKFLKSKNSVLNKRKQRCTADLHQFTMEIDQFQYFKKKLKEISKKNETGKQVNTVFFVRDIRLRFKLYLLKKITQIKENSLNQMKQNQTPGKFKAVCVKYLVNDPTSESEVAETRFKLHTFSYIIFSHLHPLNSIASTPATPSEK